MAAKGILSPQIIDLDATHCLQTFQDICEFTAFGLKYQKVTDADQYINTAYLLGPKGIKTTWLEVYWME